MARVFTLLVAVAAAGCFNPTSPDAALGKPFELKAGASSTLPDDIRLTFNSVPADSRCPIDANCIVAGDATVAISLSRSGRALEARELHTEVSRSQVSYANYMIKLTGLQPYPRLDRPTAPADYAATFVVSTQ
jgi:hypothetical protein